ncbi:uroplakin-2 [Leptodactylus fuscus]|uniref:uroplakin-2 n=1 Tax=Leptodactylus fuscus TaxID=238119 RepID=UPI003F4EE6E3
MQLLTLSAVLLLFSSSYGADTTLATGIVQNPLAYSAIIALPTECNYTQTTGFLYINGPTTQTLSITVPQCRLKRELVVISDPLNGNTDTVNVGYRVTGLTPNTNYIAYYSINGTTFTPLNFTTQNALSDPDTVFRRSGGMVVITVLLSIAMFLLLAGLIAVLVLGGRGAK